MRRSNPSQLDIKTDGNHQLQQSHLLSLLGVITDRLLFYLQGGRVLEARKWIVQAAEIDESVKSKWLDPFDKENPH